MHWQRIEQLVREEDAFERSREARGARRKAITGFPERRALRLARGGARLDQMQADRLI